MSSTQPNIALTDELNLARLDGTKQGHEQFELGFKDLQDRQEEDVERDLRWEMIVCYVVFGGKPLVYNLHMPCVLAFSSTTFTRIAFGSPIEVDDGEEDLECSGLGLSGSLISSLCS